MPALVNAHTHLDLTHVGPQPYEADQGFAGWAMMVRGARAESGLDVARSVREGVERSVQGGVVAVGDICGGGRQRPPAPGEADSRLLAFDALASSPLLGTGFLECFGVGGWQMEAVDAMLRLLAAARERATNGVRIGVQPHAPYSAGRVLYAAAAATGLPLATHMAETTAEREFTQLGKGAFKELLWNIARWDAAAASEVGEGRHPVDHVIDALEAGVARRASPQPLHAVAAHVNDCENAAIQHLASSGLSVAYCPRCHEYFGHDSAIGPHKYREMLSAGVNVCLGTDSIINVPPSQSDRLSVLDEARLLFRRDRADATLLMAMMTVNGARALGLGPSLFTLEPGPSAGLLAVDVAGTDASLPPPERILAAGGVSLGARLLDWADLETRTR